MFSDKTKAADAQGRIMDKKNYGRSNDVEKEQDDK